MSLLLFITSRRLSRAETPVQSMLGRVRTVRMRIAPTTRLYDMTVPTSRGLSASPLYFSSG